MCLVLVLDNFVVAAPFHMSFAHAIADVHQLAAGFRTVGTKNPEAKQQYVAEMASRTKELLRQSRKDYDSFVAVLFDAIEQLHARDPAATDTAAVLCALDVLLQLELSSSQLSTCNNYIRVCLKSNDSALLVAATRTYGMCLSLSPPTEIARKQLADSVSMLTDTRPDMYSRRLCAVLLLKEVAERVLVLFIPKLKEFFENIWICLADSIAELRNHAVECFKSAISVLTTRPNHSQQEIYNMLFAKIRGHLLMSKSVEHVIGALLVFNSIYLSSLPTMGATKYEEGWGLIWPICDHVVPTVRHLAIECVPTLAQYNKEAFVMANLAAVVSKALDIQRKDVDKAVAFTLLKNIIAVVGRQNFDRHLENAISVIKQCFILQKKEKKPPVWEALSCLATICTVSPSQIVEYHVLSCIEHVFCWGLSAQLVSFLKDILRSMSTETKSKLQETLLDMISMTLSGLQFRQRARQTSASAGFQPPPAVSAAEEKSQTFVALNALIDFDFSNSELMGEFLRDTVLPFLDHEDIAIRLAAVKTISGLLFPSGHLSVGRSVVIDHVISRMLALVVSDQNQVIRQAILSNFSEAFLPHLANNAYLRMLFAVCGDEDFGVRSLAVALICKLLPYNASHVLPALRKQVVSLLSNLTSGAAFTEAGLELLTTISISAPDLVETFETNFQEALRPFVANLRKDRDTASQVLRCVSAVMEACGAPFVGDNYGTLMVSSILDFAASLGCDRSSATLRLHAFKALAAIFRFGADAVQPYKRHPTLYKVITSTMRSKEETVECRTEALRIVGILGALDAHRMKEMQSSLGEGEKQYTEATMGPLTHHMCCKAVLAAVARVMDPENSSLTTSTDSVMRSAMKTLMAIVEKCPVAREEAGIVIPNVVKILLEMEDGRLRSTIFFNFTKIVRAAGPKAREHSALLFRLIESMWEKDSSRVLVLKLCSALTADRPCISQYLTRLLPKVLGALEASNEPIAHGVLLLLIRCDSLLQPHADTIIRQLLKLVEDSRTSESLLRLVIASIRMVARAVTLREYAGPIIRTVVSRMDVYLTSTTGPSTLPVVEQVAGLLCTLMHQLKADYCQFVPGVYQLFKTHRLSHRKYQYYVALLLKGQPPHTADVAMEKEMTDAILLELESSVDNQIELRMEVWGSEDDPHIIPTPREGDNIAKKADDENLPITEAKIRDSAQVQNVSSKDDWLDWFRTLSLDILQQSPYLVYRCVSVHLNSPSLAERCQTFVREILNSAFRAAWTHFSPNLKKVIGESFEAALGFQSTPDDVVLSILQLAEYMDVSGQPLAIPVGQLSSVAKEHGVLAKALRWKESEYRASPEGAASILISLYTASEQNESAVGLLNSETGTEESKALLIQSSLIRLGRYAEALELIQKGDHGASARPLGDRKASVHERVHSRTRSWSTTSDVENSFSHVDDPIVAKRLETEMSRIVCLNGLGDLHEVLLQWCKLVTRRPKKEAEKEEEEEENALQYAAPYAAEAAMQLGAWDTVDEAVEFMSTETVQRYICHAASSIHAGHWKEAHSAIDKGRAILLEDVSSLLGESYARAYDCIVSAQQLAELEETIHILTLPEGGRKAKRLEQTSAMWTDRILALPLSVAHWKKVLSTRKLLLPPVADTANRIMFAKLCREHRQPKLRQLALEELIGCHHPHREELLGKHQNPFVVLEYVKFLADDGALTRHSEYGDCRTLLQDLLVAHQSQPFPNKQFLARLFARIGYETKGPVSVGAYAEAMKLDPDWRTGWHYWAKSSSQLLKDTFDIELCAASVSAYVQSIVKGPSASYVIQDVLNLLALWSQYGQDDRVVEILSSTIMSIPASAWLLVVPQLIARMDSGRESSRNLVGEILAALGTQHPQALIYPLLVCTASGGKRQQAANVILKKMEAVYPELVAQGNMVSKELIRVSVLIHERWHSALEESATAFFTGERDIPTMLRLLLPRHETLKIPPETLTEVEFMQRYGHELNEAQDWLRSYHRTKNDADLHEAWNIYFRVFNSIKITMENHNLSLAECSPKLFEARDLALSIPQTTEGHAACIAAFVPTFRVIESKQRPRKIAILGTDGDEYRFLLKGREDLRLDERVMQLFKLVNTMLAVRPETSKHMGYKIQRYSVTPLWEDVGLIGWVDNCNTMHDLIQEYRKDQHIHVHQELKLISHLVPPSKNDFAALPVISKVEVFEYIQDHTSGHDLRRAFWARARNSEAWLDSRTTFTRSLATMSMVGYLLGLGDRHPNNIMIQNDTGKVVHIDFGDCFEVAMHRDDFPEQVPFRLTRMLRNAMEVCGVEGIFRSSAEMVMYGLRENRGNVVAMLEAFIHDPLISWRLVTTEESTTSQPVPPQPQAAGATDATGGLINIAKDAADQQSTPTKCDARRGKGQHTKQISELYTTCNTEVFRQLVRQGKVANIQEAEAVYKELNANDSGVLSDDMAEVALTVNAQEPQKEETPAERKEAKGKEVLSHQGVVLLQRLESKLQGKDFDSRRPLETAEQVAKLISQATSTVNLAQAWLYWFPFW